ncbi:MAG: hypothetical protein ACYTGC_03600, partial [Planctomycetota bacterium]
LEAPEVRRCFPGELQAAPHCDCHCSPSISVGIAEGAFGDRFVCIGDCGVTRLYKNGIGAAYHTAKAASTTAVLEGVSADDFRRHYWPVCQSIAGDNRLGRMVFAAAGLVQRSRMARRALHAAVKREQARQPHRARLSSIVWDLFTGSAPYRDVLRRGLHPTVPLSLGRGLLTRARRSAIERMEGRTA